MEVALYRGQGVRWETKVQAQPPLVLVHTFDLAAPSDERTESELQIGCENGEVITLYRTPYMYRATPTVQTSQLTSKSMACDTGRCVISL